MGIFFTRTIAEYPHFVHNCTKLYSHVVPVFKKYIYFLIFYVFSLSYSGLLFLTCSFSCFLGLFYFLLLLLCLSLCTKIPGKDLVQWQPTWQKTWFWFWFQYLFFFSLKVLKYFWPNNHIKPLTNVAFFSMLSTRKMSNEGGAALCVWTPKIPSGINSEKQLL